MNTAILERATSAIETLYTQADHLRQDIDHHRAKPTLYGDIRALRHTLQELELDLRHEPTSPIGDAC